MTDTWLLIFRDVETSSPDATWSQRFLAWCVGFLRPGFRHVQAVHPLAHNPDVAIVYNPCSTSTQIHLAMMDTVMDDIANHPIMQTATVIEVQAKDRTSVMPRIAHTCVTNVAHVIGCKSRPWWTPYKLYTHLQQQQGQAK